MDKSITSPAADVRAGYLGGLMLAIGGAVLFSTKAVIAKLLYRYHIDAVTLIAFRMIFSLPVFAAVALWKMRTEAPLSAADRWRLIGLGLVGYYLSSFLDFLGLQYITVGLERLILFLTPTFVLLISATWLRQHIGRLQWLALAVSYAGIVLVFVHDLQGGGPNVPLGSLLVLGSAAAYAAYLLLSGEMVKRIGSLRLVAYAMCVSSAACIGQYFLLRPVSGLVQPLPVYGLSLMNGLLCTVAPVFMTMTAVQRVGAGVASQAGMIGPVSTLFLGAVILAEPVTSWQLAGTALVLAGIYLLSNAKPTGK
ncbi:EamA domain-containing membrane protein RarD [Pseudoduganella flava]|uniref:EamA domain-containing membrane protein RarD n=1 Tax=Pseudoduganella flava TaxID=871742 RepID=A0A562PVB6_9BURK|nr:EamA family transporter [Pseudoduganella flava]QGZ39495.1 EamA family transporter [Pseudoduganella flava]TWI48385.1 EamA domain-containing membrane protein RarD [Pseudoduganella flava]